jgi:hypothetical protein
LETIGGIGFAIHFSFLSFCTGLVFPVNPEF